MVVVKAEVRQEHLQVELELVDKVTMVVQQQAMVYHIEVAVAVVHLLLVQMELQVEEQVMAVQV